MPMIRMRAPRDATSISMNGEEYKVEKDGYVSIPEILKAVAESHGYGKRAEAVNLDRAAVEAVGNLTKEKVASMMRGDLLIYIDENHVEVPSRASLDVLRKLVWEDFEAKQKILAKAQGK